MPGPAITKQLAACTEDSFQEVAQIFRHDFVLYAGMLQSWTTLFVDEVPDTQPVFAQMTRHLLDAAQQFLEESQARLYPPRLPDQVSHRRHTHLCMRWDRFFEDVVTAVRPRLFPLEAYLRTYIARPEFHALQTSLAPAADHERIDKMLLSAYNKLQAVLDAEQFDRRVAEVMRERQQAVRSSRHSPQ
ncbi:MAG: hypothetical protein K8J31_07440 [Anaerolineae bacterium]|nr:hypothetical protein [Anaerolineae bacterium]